MMITTLKAALPELKALPIFHGYADDPILELCKEGIIKVTNHRGFIFEQGEEATYFGVVLSGAYKLSKFSPLGEDVIVHFSTPGDVIAAFIMAVPNAKYPISAKSMGPSRCLKIPRSTYINIWKNYPELIFKVQSLLSTRMNVLQDQKAMEKAPLPSKVASLLIQLMEKQAVQSSTILPIPLTRKEIAESLGASVESVIRVMSDWSKSGTITTNDQHIQIHKPATLLELINTNHI